MTTITSQAQLSIATRIQVLHRLLNQIGCQSHHFNDCSWITWQKKKLKQKVPSIGTWFLSTGMKKTILIACLSSTTNLPVCLHQRNTRLSNASSAERTKLMFDTEPHDINDELLLKKFCIFCTLLEYFTDTHGDYYNAETEMNREKTLSGKLFDVFSFFLFFFVSYQQKRAG